VAARAREHAVIEPRRAASFVRAHAIAAPAAIVVAIVTIAVSTSVMVREVAQHRGDVTYSHYAPHLALAAPLWFVAAWQLFALRRRVEAGRVALAVAAIGLALAGAAAIGVEAVTDVAPGRRPDDGWLVLSLWGGLGGLLAWMVGACAGLARIAARLGASPLHLDDDDRARAQRLGVVLYLIPWSLLVGFCGGVLGSADIALGALALGVLAMTGAQLSLAALVARSRELAPARIRSSR
jgi:hypothetical protein